MSLNTQNDPFARQPRVVDSQRISDIAGQEFLGFDNSIPQTPPIPPKLHNLRSNPKFVEENSTTAPKPKTPTPSTIINTIPVTISISDLKMFRPN